MLAVIAPVEFADIRIWPEFGRNEVPIGLQVDRDFTIGYWSDFRELPYCWYVGADLDGFGGGAGSLNGGPAARSVLNPWRSPAGLDTDGLSRSPVSPGTP